MENQAAIYHFPGKEKKAKRVQNIDGVKYFNASQIKLLRRTARDRAELDRQKGKVTGVREWMLIDLLTSTGMREGEASDLRCGDIRAGYGQSEVFIRNGKGGRSRTVQIPDGLKKHLTRFITWKADRKEPTGEDDHLFIGQRGSLSSQGIQQIVKRYLKMLALYERGKSVHALRHSYATEFYGRCKDLRGLQKQLGHASIQTTQIYADVSKETIKSEVLGLWN